MEEKKIILLVLVFLLVGSCARRSISEEEPRGGECLQDSDCAIAGCSGQVCATASEAPGVITTCEYREVYACYKEAGCGCTNGRCVWNKEKLDACVVRLGLAEV